MPWNVLIFPLLGGFVCLDWCFITRLRNQRIEGNRLLLEAAFVGAWLIMLTRVLLWLAGATAAGKNVSMFWRDNTPRGVPFLGTGILALLLGLLAAFLINLLVDRDFAKRKAIERVGDMKLLAFYEAALRFELVQVILESNKVYVGLVSIAPDLRLQNDVVLLPVLEGYRSKDTLELQYAEKRKAWTYAVPEEERRWSELIIPLDSVKSVDRVKNLRDLREEKAPA